MANFSPGWNFSPVSRAEISPWPPEQIFLKRRLRLHGENVSPGWNSKTGLKPGWDFQPGLKLRKTSCNRIKISARAEKWALACSVIVFSAKQDGGLPLFTAILNFTRAETSHVIATKFQPGGRAEISARAETRHVIGPLMLERGYERSSWTRTQSSCLN